VPIHDQSYRRYSGERERQGRAWTVIAGTGIKNMLGKRKFLGLLIVAWLPFVVRAVMMYFAANFPQMSMIAPSPESFRQFLDQQGIWTFFITIFTGAAWSRTTCVRTPCRSTCRSRSAARVHRREVRRPRVLLLLVTWLPATMLLGLIRSISERPSSAFSVVGALYVLYTVILSAQ